MLAHPRCSRLLLVAVSALTAPSISAQGPIFTFDGLLPPDAGRTQEVHLSDIDADGDLDAFVADTLGSRLLRNNGAGRYTDITATHFVGSVGAITVATEDFDGDGDLDAWLGVGGQDRLYLNDGTGVFTDFTATNLPALSENTLSLVAKDFDGDMDVDVVAGIFSGGPNRLYLNDGSGVFTEVSATNLPPNPENNRCLAAGDVDGDLDIDLFIGNQGLNRLWLNDGLGVFTDFTSSLLPSVSTTTRSVRMVDLDADADLDLVLGNDGQNELYLNDGLGSFSQNTATHLPAFSDFSYGISAGDLDGDTDIDLFFANGNGPRQNRVLLNNGSAIFTEAPVSSLPLIEDTCYGADLGDIDGDGDLDVLLANFEDQNRLYLNDGVAVFSDGTFFNLPMDQVQTFGTAFADLDGDGDLDCLLANAYTQDLLLRNDGDGRFVDDTSGNLPIASDWSDCVALADVDGDGDVDALIGKANLQNVLYLNDGTGSFSDWTATNLPVDADRTEWVEFGDVDADGDLDVLLASRYSASRLYRNDGAGAFEDVTALRFPTGAPDALCTRLADVDADGDLDAIFGRNGSDRLWLNDGSGFFTDASSNLPAIASLTFELALMDLDGDFDLDIVSASYAAQNRVFFNNGSGVFTDLSATRLPADSDPSYAVALGDLDGDGDVDLIFGNDAVGITGQNDLLLNDGTGVFSDSTTAHLPLLGNRTSCAVLADVDGDNDLDLFFGNRAQQNHLFVNTTSTARVEIYGAGCASAHGTPRIFAGGFPALGNPAFSIELRDTRAFSLCVLIGGLSRGDEPGACTNLLVENMPFMFTIFSDVQGAARIVTPIANDPLIDGLEVHFQFAVLDPSGGFAGSYALSEGLHVIVGDCCP